MFKTRMKCDFVHNITKASFCATTKKKKKQQAIQYPRIVLMLPPEENVY